MKIKCYFLVIILVFIFSNTKVLFAQSKEIIFITPDERDDEQIDFLESRGFQVIPIWPGEITTADPDTLDMLDTADLIIIGRSPQSSNFKDANKEAWNALSAPIIANSPWDIRNTRLNWFNNIATYHLDEWPDTAYVSPLDISDPIFAECEILNDSIPWCMPPHDFINVLEATNAEIVATFLDSSVVIARFETGVEFYPGSVDMPAGPRTYFGFGNDNTGLVNFFPLTESAKQAYLREILKLLYTTACTIEAPIVYDTSITYEVDPIPELVASATGTVKWYSNADLTNLLHEGSSYTQAVSDGGTYTYFVTQTDGCESYPDNVALTIVCPVVPPEVKDALVYYGEPVPDLVATGTNINWYSDEELQTLLHTGNTFATGHTEPGAYTYWVTQTDGCESDAVQVTLSIRRVIFISTTGSDITGDGTESNPYATIQHGIDTAVNNENAILILPGTYTENVNLNEKHIIIGSLFMHTSDTSYISQTILDGSSTGTVFYSYKSDFTLIGLTLQNGQAGDKGAGGLEITEGTCTIKNCKFLYNNGIGADQWGAGGLVCNNGNYRIINCTFKKNYSPGGASAIRAGGCNIYIMNTLIIGNTGNMAIHYNDASGTVLNTTITGNEAGIGFNNSTIMVRNCILWNNNMDNWYSGVLWNINYTNSESGLAGTGNINEDPSFVKTADGDYRLRYGSPCINAGTSDTSGLNLSPTDLTGNPRIYNGRIDMGAYESIIPDIPDTTTICYSEHKPNIIASGNDIKWYTDEMLTNMLHNGDTLTPDVSKPETDTYYTYYVTQTLNNESVPKKVILTVKPSPEEPEIILKGSDILICLDSGMYSYNWYYEDEQFINETKQFFEVKNPLAGNYYVETGNENNCKTRSDQFNFTSKSENLKSGQPFIETYPVPNTGNFTFKLTGDESGRVIINIRDYFGTTVKSLIIYKSTGSLSEEIDLLSVPKGIYMVEILFNNETYCRRIVIN